VCSDGEWSAYWCGGCLPDEPYTRSSVSYGCTHSSRSGETQKLSPYREEAEPLWGKVGVPMPEAVFSSGEPFVSRYTKNICGKAFQEADTAYAKFKAIFARYSSIGTALRRAIKSLPVCPTSVLNFWLLPVARA
jgi:hypothetical protein